MWALAATTALSLGLVFSENRQLMNAPDNYSRNDEARVVASEVNLHADAGGLAAADYSQVLRDIFKPPTILLPPLPTVKVEGTPIEAGPAPEPTPPPIGYRYMGRMRSPEGQVIVWLERQDQAIEANVGTQLADGYVVEKIEDRAIELLYPPLGVKALIAVPPPSDSDVGW